MILTVAHSKGGVGKSTLAWNLANAFLQENLKVKIIDLDFQQTLYFINALANGKFEVLQPKTAADFLDILEAKQEDEYIIIDTGGFDIDINRLAIKYADKVLVPLSESPMDIIGFETFKKIIEESETEINIVLNNVSHLQKDFSAVLSVLDLDKVKLLETKIIQRKIYKTVLADGNSIFESNNLKAIKEIKSLLDEIIEEGKC